MSDQRFTFAQMAEEMAKLVYSKTCWLADFSSGPRKRPDHEIQNKSRELAVLQQAEADYRRAAERGGA